MAAEMTNIDIREFTTLSGTDGEDSVLLVQESGANGRIKIALFKQLLTSHVIPSIVEGTWWIGDAPTGVTAIGKTPLLRRGKLGVEYKYDTDDNTMWRLLINYDDIVLRYQDLTEMQRHELSGKNAYLRKEKDYIQWSLGKDGMYDGWQNLIPLLDIKGNKGDPALFRRNGDFVQTNNTEGGWEDLYNIRDYAGAVEFALELGNRTDLAVSQKLLTDSLKGLSSTLGGLNNVNRNADDTFETIKVLAKLPDKSEFEMVSPGELGIKTGDNINIATFDVEEGCVMMHTPDPNCGNVSFNIGDDGNFYVNINN